jgi:hypothetical protein
MVLAWSVRGEPDSLGLIGYPDETELGSGGTTSLYIRVFGSPAWLCDTSYACLDDCIYSSTWFR